VILLMLRLLNTIFLFLIWCELMGVNYRLRTIQILLDMIR